MNNKISFFGASVTQQKDGYWKYFADLNPSLTITNFGYGSRHLNDAGVCYIDTVLENKPEYCFIDWFSTGYIKYNEDKFEEIKEYIDTIIHKFYTNGVKLIFLIIPDITVDKQKIYQKIYEYLKSISIPVINISESFNDLSTILRDGIHTTPLGSQEYAKLISDEFNRNLYNKIEIPETYPNKTKYCDVKFKNLNLTITDKLVVKGPCEVIGISQIIGPYTGIVDIDGIKINNWDRWCYYEREMVNLKFKVNHITTIKVLEEDFDRSNCEHQINWNTKKILRLMTVFYVGNDFQIVEYS